MIDTQLRLPYFLAQTVNVNIIVYFTLLVCTLNLVAGKNWYLRLKNFGEKKSLSNHQFHTIK